MKRKNRPRKQQWQTGDFDRHQQFTILLPYPVLLLCKLAGVSPRQLVVDFMDNLACGSWKNEGRELVRLKLIDYFLQHEYGSKFYSIEQRKQIFNELLAIGMLYPKDADQEIMKIHVQWRELYQEYWFKKWYTLHHREPLNEK